MTPMMYLLPLVLVALLVGGLLLLKKTMPVQKFRQTLQIIGLVCCVLSVIAIIISWSYSRDNAQLFKLTLPALIAMILAGTLRQNKNVK